MEVQDIISSGLLELYVSGLSSEEESEKVENWGQIYPEVREELEAIQDALENYAASLAIQPDPTVKDKILAQIQRGLKHYVQVKSQPIPEFIFDCTKSANFFEENCFPFSSNKTTIESEVKYCSSSFPSVLSCSTEFEAEEALRILVSNELYLLIRFSNSVTPSII